MNTGVKARCNLRYCNASDNVALKFGFERVVYANDEVGECMNQKAMLDGYKASPPA